jgi:hypothetical protein
MLTQLQLRVFYSFQDSRGAAFVGLLTMAVSIAADYIALSTLPRLDVVAGLGIAYGISNLVGTIVGWAALLRRVGSLDGRAIARSLTRMHAATVPGLVWAANTSRTTPACPTACSSRSSAAAARSCCTRCPRGPCGSPSSGSWPGRWRQGSAGRAGGISMGTDL